MKIATIAKLVKDAEVLLYLRPWTKESQKNDEKGKQCGLEKLWNSNPQNSSKIYVI